MASVPADLSTERGPPLSIPLRHFVVSTGFPLVGVAVGLAALVAPVPGALLAHVHLLLAGWVCVTIMGALTQFVPVWSGVDLYSRRLATAQLPLAVAGVLGMAAALLAGRLAWLAVAGLLLLAGLWTMVYNVGRTLRRARPLDVTERHFAFALACFVVVPAMGVLLAADYVLPVLGPGTLARTDLVGAHVTLAVFGAVLATVVGALYQLATMFTGTELRGVDVPLQRLETVAYPAGVVALAAGRLFDVVAIARLGAALVLFGLAAVGVVLAHRLLASTVRPSAMHRRYAVVAVALLTWVAWTAPAWLADPTAPGALLGPRGAVHLLTFGAVGFVVLGTLYHVVPFLVWVHRYADLLGLEPVPLVDELYDPRVARADLLALSAGLVALVLADGLGLPRDVRIAGGLLVAAGFALFSLNVLLVVRRHAPGSLRGVLVGRGDAAPPEDGARGTTTEDRGTTGR